MSDYSSNFPQQRPVFSFNADAGKLDSRLSYSRSSSGTYLSNEKSLNSENLISQSADLGSWSQGSSPYTTITSNATAAPDGTTTAAQIEGLTGSGKKAIYHPISAGAGSYTGIFYVKPNGHEYVQIMFGSVATIYQNFHLSGSGTLGNGTNDAASIDKMGDWYRITITSDAISSASNFYVVMVDSNTAARYEDSVSTSSIFAWGANFSSTNQKVFNSTTSQIHREYSPLLKTASADSPRFEYDASGNSEGLLIESQATNLQRYGSDFASWSNKPNLIITSDAAMAPSGLLQADLVVADSTGGLTYVQDNTPVIASGTTYTGSVYVKKAGQRYIQLTGGTGTFGTSQYATFDLDDGSVDVNGGVTASAVNVGNGWWRIQATMTATGSGSGGVVIAFVNSATATRLASFTGNDFDGVMCWGCQLETGSAASSLVDTGSGSSQLSRASDSCSVPTADFGFTGGQVSIVAETEAGAGAGNNPRLFNLNDGSDTTRLMLYKNSTSADNTVAWDAYYGASGMGTLAGSNNSSKVAVSVDTNDFAADSDTGTLLTNASGSQHSFSHLYIGSNYNGTAHHLNGHIKRLSLFSVALSDTELAALTS